MTIPQKLFLPNFFLMQFPVNNKIHSPLHIYRVRFSVKSKSRENEESADIVPIRWRILHILTDDLYHFNI